MEVKGKLVKKLAVESGMSKAEKEWKKQTIVVDTGAEYNPEIAIQAFGDDKIKELNKLSIGDDVLIKCNVSSREYNGRYFHNIDGWFFSKNVREESKELDVHFEGTTPDDLPF